MRGQVHCDAGWVQEFAVSAAPALRRARCITSGMLPRLRDRYRQDVGDAPAGRRLHESLVHQKRRVGRWLPGRSDVERDRDVELRGRLADQDGLQVRHVGRELPGALIQGFEPLERRLASPDRRAAGHPEEVRRVEQQLAHGNDVVRVLRLHELIETDFSVD